MTHYIDLCKVKIVSEKFFDENEDALISVGDVRRALLMAPVEDVAPRAEVAREIFEEIEDVINGIGYFDELDLKVLKKKYAEEQK